MKLYNIKQIVFIEAELNQVTFVFSDGSELITLSEKYICDNEFILSSIARFVKNNTVQYMNSDLLLLYIDSIIESELLNIENGYNNEMLNQYKLNIQTNKNE